MSARGRTSLWPSVLTRGLATTVWVALGLLPVSTALAQATPQPCPPGTPANVICNGSGAGASELGPTLKGAFLFEPEFPLNSLKSLPIWNELEQLLDDPYRQALCSSLSLGLQADGTTVSGLDRTTSGTTFIEGSPPPVVYPAYCSRGVVRRPGFGVALPPLMLHPLNYNPTDGEEMRLLNPGFAGAPWIVPDHLVQCGSPEALNLALTAPTGCEGTRTAIGPGGLPVTSIGPFDSNRWVWTYTNVTITPGSPRVGEPTIDYNAPIVADPGLFPLNPSAFVCEITTEVLPAEGSMICGGDPGEPGHAAFGSLATVAVNVNIDTFTIPPASVCALATFNLALCMLRQSAQVLALTFPVGSPQRNFLLNAAPLQEPLTPARLALFVDTIRNSTNAAVRGTLVVQVVSQQQPSLTASYSTPAVPGSTPTNTAGLKLSDPFRGVINPRHPGTGAGGLSKPSLRVPEAGGSPSNPNYLVNRTDTGPVAADPSALKPSNENDYVRNRTIAAVLGKSLFWEQQVGSDTVQACGSCHPHAGADNRTKNQMNPNDIALPIGDMMFEVGTPPSGGFTTTPTLFGANHDLVASDFPIHKLFNPEIAGDPKCDPAIKATLPALSALGLPLLENNFPDGFTDLTVCDKANIANQRPDGTDQNDVASSMGVHFGVFLDIPTPDPTPGGAAFNVLTDGVASLKPDLRSTIAADLVDPIPGFASDGTGTDTSGHQFRRVEPRNTPTVFAAALNFDNFWDGRARHDFNGGSVFGAADPQSHVFVKNNSDLVATRQLIRFVSIASLATGPALSKFEMSFVGRNWAKLGKKLLQDGVTPLAEQLVDPADGVIGPYSNQGGSACASVPIDDVSPAGAGVLPTLAPGKPGLCISYPGLIRQAFYPALWQPALAHLNGCYTDGRPDIHPNQCGTTVGTTVYPAAAPDPFDGFVLSIATGAASPTDTNQFTHMEGNMSLFFGLSIAVWGTLLIPDNTPFDQFLDQNPDMFESIGEVGEPGLVGPMPVCDPSLDPARYGTYPNQRHCFREVGNFKRDSSFANFNQNNCLFPHPGEGVITQTLVSVAPCKGTRDPSSNAPDPLLGMDLFQGSNYSLKNPNFRAARCGECHAGATLTDNTMPFTFKAQLGDFIGEFITAGNEALVEPLGMTRVITGFLLEDELNANGQDAIERRIINQSIVPCPTGNITAGLAFPDGVAGPFGLETVQGLGHGLCQGAGSALFDNGVYNLGVTICDADQEKVLSRCDDNGRGNTDPFGWPMSLAALLMKKKDQIRWHLAYSPLL